MIKDTATIQYSFNISLNSINLNYLYQNFRKNKTPKKNLNKHMKFPFLKNEEKKKKEGRKTRGCKEAKSIFKNVFLT